MKQNSDEQLVFVENPLQWRMIGFVLVALAAVAVIAMWRFGAEVFGADTMMLTVVRAIVGLVALIAFVFGASLIRLPVRTLRFDSGNRTLQISEKAIFGGSTRNIPFSRFADVVTEEDELENSVIHRCAILLDDDESIDIPAPEYVDSEVVAEMRRDIAVFVGLEEA